MKIRKLGFFEILLPIVIVAFAGQGTSFVVAVFSNNTRWLVCLLLLFYLLFSGRFFNKLNDMLMAILFFYFSWCILTTTWSTVPLLSFLKSSAFFLVSLTMIVAGKVWVRKYSWERSLDWLFFLAVIALLSGILGRGVEGALDVGYGSGAIDLYQGLTGNANMFGMLQTMAFPFLLWKAYKNWKVRKLCFIWGGLLALAVFFLLESYSRSALLAALSVCFIFFISLSSRKKYVILINSIIIFSFSFVLMAPVAIKVLSAHLYKDNRADADLFSTRRSVWDDSYEAAVYGGWLGIGYGSAVAQENYKLQALSSGAYTREKGNSQLAIIEETGVVGLILYTTFLVIFSIRAIKCYRELNGSEKVLMGLVLGSLLGLLISSIFEAWWDAPGSPEAVYFWTMTGIAMGLMQVTKKEVIREYFAMEAMHR